jgi:hypothetical protein
MKQKGFINQYLAVAVLLIVAVVSYFAFVERLTVTNESRPSPETERLFILIGKRPTPPNANLYRGYVIIEGMYSVDYSDNILGGGMLHFTVDEQYRGKLPKRYNEYPLGFIFDNESLAKQMLGIRDGDKTICSLEGRARIAIEDYTTELLESEVFDHTNLATVLSHTSLKIQRCGESPSI